MSPTALATVAATTTASLILSTTSSIAALQTSGPLHLNVKATGPDPLGISRVNGFYGPGTWADWFLTILASWYRLISNDKKRIDPNTWLYLLATNWAAIDLLRHTRIWEGLLDHGSATEFSEKKLGSIAAAMMLTWWGIFHGMMQLTFSMKDLGAENPRRQRGYRTITVAIGLLVPIVSLCVSVCKLDTFVFLNPFGQMPSAISPSLPALYWSAVEIRHHIVFLRLARLTSLYLIGIVLFMFWCLLLNLKSRRRDQITLWHFLFIILLYWYLTGTLLGVILLRGTWIDWLVS